MIGVMAYTAWEAITNLTSVVRPMVVMFWPSQVASLSAALSSRYWKSTVLSCQTESGSPRYFIGKVALDTGTPLRT